MLIEVCLNLQLHLLRLLCFPNERFYTHMSCTFLCVCLGDWCGQNEKRHCYLFLSFGEENLNLTLEKRHLESVLCYLKTRVKYSVFWDL